MSKALKELDRLISEISSPAAAGAPSGKGAASGKAAKPAAEPKTANGKAPAPEAAAPAAPDPELERKFGLVRSVGEECVTDSELRNLLLKKPNFVLYDGFEPSGRMHIAQGIYKAMNVNKCTAAGGTFVFWVADWFALMNDKMGGDLERIKTVGQYLIQVWTAAGMDMSRVKFLWSSEEICKHAQPYWTQALDIARKFTVARIKKCCQIMGRLEDTLTAAQASLWAPPCCSPVAPPHPAPPPINSTTALPCHRTPTGPARRRAPATAVPARADTLPDHAVHRHLLPKGGHLPAGRRPAQGEHARARVLRRGGHQA